MSTLKQNELIQFPISIIPIPISSFCLYFEIYIIWRMFPKYLDPVTSAGWDKNFLATCLSFSKMNLLLWHQHQVNHLYKNLHCSTYRSSRRRCSVRKGVRNSTKFEGKHLCQSLWQRCFPVNFTKFLLTPFLQNTSGRLLFYLIYLWILWVKSIWTYKYPYKYR